MVSVITSLFSRRCLEEIKSCALRKEIGKTLIISVRNKIRDVDLPKITVGFVAGAYRRKIHFPDKYTVKPLEVTNLAGRDPVSGRIVIKGIGGGIKHKYHWIEWKRDGPKDGPPLVEKVLQIMDDGCRTSKIALVACGDKMKYYLATSNMKAGDLIRTSKHIPRNPVLAYEGDAYPLGALPINSIVCNIEKLAGKGGFYCHAAGTFAKLINKYDDRVIIKIPSGRQIDLSQECMATVGRISNIDHGKTPIGSAQKNRELGNRPASGLWQRKTGRFGRKIRPPPPVKVIKEEDCIKEQPQIIKLTLNNDMHYNSKLWGLNRW